MPLLQFLRQRFAARRDTEHEQAFIRLAVGAVLTVYLFFTIEEHGPAFWICFGVFHTMSLGILLSIILRPAASPTRRVLGCVCDSTTATLFMIQSGLSGIMLFLVYLWITIGNGFRYGSRYLLISLGLSMAGFGAVLMFSDFWRQQPAIGVALLTGLLVLSLYVNALVNRLSVALLRAEAANIAKRQFVSTISHEMRTPLNAILGMAQLMHDTSLNGEQKEMLETVDAASHSMLDLVNDVLDFSRIEAGKLTLAEENFDLYALVNSAAQVVRAQAEHKGLRFHISIMPDVPPYLRGDHARLRQVLINLLGNSVKFTDHGEVTLHVARLGDEGDRVKLKISVRDTGVGIAPELQACIFESFTQADQSVTRRYGGSGLGTTIAKQLVELMDGRIGVESAVGLGSTFWFEVALQKNMLHDEAADAAALKDHRFLLAGFDHRSASELSKLIEGWGGIAFTSSLEEAASLAVAQARQNESFCCALIYASTAGEAEAAQARILRGLDAHRLPIVLCTPAASEFAENRPSAVFSAILRLPIEKNLLFNVLHSLSLPTSPTGVIFISDYLKRKDIAQSLKILIADDNATNRLVLTRILERALHSITAVESGNAALDILERERFDLVIFDRNMPGIGGVEALRAFRVMEVGSPRTPTLVLSADVSDEAKHEALNAGADLYLTKPVHSATLLEAISSLAFRTSAGDTHAEQAIAAALNYETLAHLKTLGSTDDFLDKLVHMFLEDNTALLNDMRRAAEAKRFDEVRALAHALKGSAGSVGLDRLTGLCNELQKAHEGDLRMRGASYIESIRKEFELARGALLAYLGKQKTQADSGKI